MSKKQVVTRVKTANSSHTQKQSSTTLKRDTKKSNQKESLSKSQMSSKHLKTQDSKIITKKVSNKKQNHRNSVKSATLNVKSIITNKTISVAKNKTANLVSKTFTSSEKKSNSNNNKGIHYSTDFMPIKEIRNGIIVTTDNRYIKILEIMPNNFRQRKPEEQEYITRDFAKIFKICPQKIMFITTSNKADVRDIIYNINESTSNEHDKSLLRSKEDYVKYIENIKDYAGIITRYFIVYEYQKSKEEGVKNDFNTVYQTMASIAGSIKDVMKLCGNDIVEHTMDQENHFQLEILYEYFNKKSSYTESLDDRIRRMNYDQSEYDKLTGSKKKYMLADYIAPKGLGMEDKNLIWQDGTWYTYLTIKDTGYPLATSTGWLDMFANGVGIDVTVTCKKQPQQLVYNILNKKNLLDGSALDSRFTTVEKARIIKNTIYNNSIILEGLRNSDDLFRVVTTFIFWGDNPKDLFRARNSMIRLMKTNRMEAVKPQYDCQEYYENTSPFMTYNNAVFRRDGHDFLSSSLATIYNYTKYMLYTKRSMIVGTNRYNGSIAAFNNFETTFYKNANMNIFGTPGSGKSFFEMLFGRRSRLTGISTYYILPVKGYEYQKLVESLGGEYVKLTPGSNCCINIMEIYPEGFFDDGQVDEDFEMANNSLLAKKIASLITWVQLRINDKALSRADKSLLSSLLTSIYDDYGITNDNESIFDIDDKGRKSLKVMPTLKTFYDRANEMPEKYQYIIDMLEEFISGQYQNFVGQTNINLHNKCIAFDVNERQIDKADLPSIIYIAFDLAYSLTASNEGFSDIIIDEFWKLLVNEEVGEQVKSMSKLIRGYGGGLITATQEINDLLENPYGLSVINNAKIKLFFNMEKTQIKKLSELIDLTYDDQEKIQSFRQGSALFSANGMNIPIDINASNYEFQLFNTDKNHKTKK